jgi:FKBP-type peptidyl-prolyl cis-trans isomerase FkpA
MKNVVATFTLLFVLFSCNEKKPIPIDNNEWSKQKSVDFNQEINEREVIQIALFLDHHTEYKMSQTETGLRYMIYKDSLGNVKPAIGQQVYLSLKISLLDGTQCYASEELEDEVFVVDKSDKESGLNEAVKLLSIGDKAKLILPSHLAHGLLGDFDKIPPQSILLIDVQLNNIK